MFVAHLPHIQQIRPHYQRSFLKSVKYFFSDKWNWRTLWNIILLNSGICSIKSKEFLGNPWERSLEEHVHSKQQMCPNATEHIILMCVLEKLSYRLSKRSLWKESYILSERLLWKDNCSSSALVSDTYLTRVREILICSPQKEHWCYLKLNR